MLYWVGRLVCRDARQTKTFLVPVKPSIVFMLPNTPYTSHYTCTNSFGKELMNDYFHFSSARSSHCGAGGARLFAYSEASAATVAFSPRIRQWGLGELLPCLGRGGSISRAVPKALALPPQPLCPRAGWLQARVCFTVPTAKTGLNSSLMIKLQLTILRIQVLNVFLQKRF